MREEIHSGISPLQPGRKREVSISFAHYGLWLMAVPLAFAFGCLFGHFFT